MIWYTRVGAGGLRCTGHLSAAMQRIGKEHPVWAIWCFMSCSELSQTGTACNPSLPYVISLIRSFSDCSAISSGVKGIPCSTHCTNIATMAAAAA